jgi:transcriptional regulator with XRE-family HTH domain
MSEKINTTVATQLKKARAEKGWSLDVASQYCGVSKAMLGQIERGESSPTIARLWKIATGFSLPLSDFLGQKDNQELAVKGLAEGQAISFKTIFEYDKNTGIEVFDLTFASGHEQYSEAHQVGVIEHIVVINGSMEYLSGGQWQPLSVGDKAKFKADQEHAYRNVGDGPLQFFNIIYYPRS